MVVDWSPQMLDYLRCVTRELKFDWSRISDHMREHVQRLGSDANSSSSSGQVPIDPATCRLMFARDYRFDASASIVKAEETAGKVSLLDPPPSSTAGNVAAQSSLPSTKNFENMSLDELISHVDSTEQAMKQQKEDIFRRVMNSLGIEGGGSSSGPNSIITAAASASGDHSAVREAYEEGIATRELERSKRLRHQAELEERRRLEADREALRRRFDRDDAEGGGEGDLLSVDCYSRTGLDATAAAGMDDGKASKLYSAYQDEPSTSTYDPSVGRALTSYFETEEFECILSQLERELDRMAVAKDEGKVHLPLRLSVCQSVYIVTLFASLYHHRCISSYIHTYLHT